MANETRACGECTACCFTHSVKAVATPLFSLCTHCTVGKGCAIYESRPVACSVYRCLWLTGKLGGEKMRPDRFGLILDVWELGDLPKPALIAWEYQAGKLAEAERWLKDFSERTGDVVIKMSLEKRFDLLFPSSMDEQAKADFIQAIITALESQDSKAA